MLIDLDTAKAHIRQAAGYPDAQIMPYLLAAEAKAQQFLNRKIFADAPALAAAVAAVPAALTAAGASYAAEVAVVDAEPDMTARCVLQSGADRRYAAAQDDAQETLAGMVINDQVRGAILELFRCLYERRDGSEAMPVSIEWLLWDYRVRIGV
jgi:hypothetical protein